MLSAYGLCRQRIPSLQTRHITAHLLRTGKRGLRTNTSNSPFRRVRHRSDEGYTRNFFRNAPFRPGLFLPTTVVIKPSHPVSHFDDCHALLASRSNRDSPPINPSDIPSRCRAGMLSYVQVVCAPTADTPGASVLLHYDNRRYLFGALSEGTQRIMTQQKVGMSKLDQLFLTGPITWQNTGGILGMMLTIADVVALRFAPDNDPKKKNKTKDLGMPPSTSLKINGAENLTHMLATARKFIFRKGMPLLLNERVHVARSQNTPARSPDFEDANIKVWFVSLKPQAGDKPHGRKRSHEDMVAEDLGQPLPADNAAQKDEDRKLLKSVVDDMFNSDWKLDALIQTTLHQVQLPATVFVKNEAGEIETYKGPFPGSNTNEPVPDIPVLVRSPWPATRIQRLPSTTPSTHSLSYIVKGQPRRGKFNVVEAQRFGVAKLDYKRIIAGETVQGKDGIDVTRDMCVAPDVEGRAFAFIDIPDSSYIDEFLDQPEWTHKEITGTIEIMYWRLGPGVVHDSRLQEFMKARESVRHSIFSSDVTPNSLALVSAAINTIKSHWIDPDRFPLPVFTNELKVNLPKGVSAAQPGAKLQLAPQVKSDGHNVISRVQTKDALKSIDGEVAALANQARQKASDAAFLAQIEEAEKDIPKRDTEIITLGTGSAIPSKYRNVSATLVRIPGVGSYLLDCGENTLGQLRRMYGFDKTEDILRDLKVIWISHLHADHHLGLASVIAAWRDATATTASSPDVRLPRLTVLSHSHMINWVREYADVEDIGLERVHLAPIYGPSAKETLQDPWIPNPTLAADTGLTSLESCRVDHCNGALACVLTWPSGLKIAYSGDCRPSPAFAALGRNATLLIHEATLDDELLDDARTKKHSTMSEALGIARDMRARRVLLTHFSQRYPKIANAYAQTGEAAVPDQAVMVSFDLMCVKLGDFRKAELFLPALRKLYEDAEEDEPPVA